MPIVVTVRVSSPADQITAGYDSIKIYRSNYEDGAFLEVSTDATRPVLSASQIYYNFEDSSGTSSSWYKTSFYHSITTAESSLSTAARGIEIETEHVNTTYPVEISLTSSDEYHINRIRYYIGDTKKVAREYISPQCTSGYQNVSEDGYTYQLENKGWPLRVVKDSVEYTTLSEPYITGYSFVTFSGAPLSTVTGTLDVWYETFRHSDREILGVFNTTPEPPFVNASTVSSEMYRIGAAITLIRSEIAQLMGETSGSFTLQGEMSYNPEPLLRQKKQLLDELQDKLDELAEEVFASNITGVRID